MKKQPEKMTQIEIEENILELLRVYPLAHKIAILEKMTLQLFDFKEDEFAN